MAERFVRTIKESCLERMCREQLHGPGWRVLLGFAGNPNPGSRWPCRPPAAGSRPGARTARASLLVALIFPDDQPAMPSQQRGRRHDGRQIMKHAPAQFLGSDRQASALVVAKAQSLTSEL